MFSTRAKKWIQGLSLGVLACAIYWLVWERYGFSYQGIAVALYVAAFGYIAVVDIYTRSIPNYLSVSALALGLLLGSCWPGTGLTWALAGASTGFGFLLLIWFLPRMDIGAGDVKLAAGIGATTGFPLVMFGLLVAFFSVGITAIAMLMTRSLTRSDNIPFGPFLALGGLVSLLWGEQVSTWYLGRLGWG